jgi:RTX calcium-binding nonapeptide repeat (4 copies)
VSVRGVLMLKAAAVAGLLMLGASFAPAASARMRCSYSGAPQNQLTVTADRGALGEITRRGQEIVVREFLARSSPCQGGIPTVLNTDTITVFPRGEEDFVDVLLGGGAFAPGATPETEGASEIEIEFEGREAFGEVGGTGGADEFHWGPGPGNHAGLNLNPRDAGDQDVDVTLRGGFFAFLVAAGGSGNDTIVPAPGAPFRNRGVFSEGGRGDDRLIAPRNSGGILEGGAGDDLLVGGRQDDELLGGDGNDRLRGAGGADLIAAGRGRDLIFGGPGRDRINSGADVLGRLPRDSVRDRIGCGAGRDRVNADRQDRLRRCEVIRRA